jgi:hypothetical protein
VFHIIKRCPKGAAGGVLWVLAAALIALDCDDGKLGVLSAVAVIPLTSGLSLIIMAVMEWHVGRIRRTMFTVVELMFSSNNAQEPEPRMRLVKH